MHRVLTYDCECSVITAFVPSLHMNSCTNKIFLPSVFTPRPQEALILPVCAHHAISGADFNVTFLLQMAIFKSF